MKKKLHNLFHTPKEGQSLVEMAIAVPLLLFLMIGVFEVGWALRGYLVLVNVNREATRYAVRPGYMDFSTQQSMAVSYTRVLSWTRDALSAQLKLNFDDISGDSTLIISHLVVDTGQPCEDMDANYCKCSDFKVNQPLPSYTFAKDDLILHPKMPGQEYQQKRFGPATGAGGYSRNSRVDFNKVIQEQLLPQNNQFNCEMIKRGGIPSSSNAIVTELFYDQPQLFGFPFVSNPLTDPVPLYSHTVMRIVDASRGELTTNIDTLGPICMAYPITIHKDKVPPIFGSNQIQDILDGSSNHGLSSSANDRGFLAWNPDQTLSTSTLEEEVDYPQLSITNYKNAANKSDTSLSVGDYVKSLPGNNGGVNDSSDPRLDALVGRNIVIPVWDDWNDSLSAYRIQRFIIVRLTRPEPQGINLTSNNPVIEAVYVGEAENCNQLN